MRDNSGYEVALALHGEEVGLNESDEDGEEVSPAHLIPGGEEGAPETITPGIQRLIEREAADMLKEALRRLLIACKYNPTRVIILAGRMAGLSYAEAGKAQGMSKQATAKHLREIGKLNPQLVKVARKRYRITPALAENIANTAEGMRSPTPPLVSSRQ